MCTQVTCAYTPSFSIVPFTGAGSLEQCRKLCLWKLSVSGQQLWQVNSLFKTLIVNAACQESTRQHVFLLFFRCISIIGVCKNWKNCNLFNVNTRIQSPTKEASHRLSLFFPSLNSPSLRKSRMHRAKSYPDNRQEFSGESNPQEKLLPMFNILSDQGEILC